MADLIGHTTGYDTEADFGETSPALDGSLSSKASITDPAGLVSFIWPVFDLYPGRYIDLGGGSEEMWGILG